MKKILLLTTIFLSLAIAGPHTNDINQGAANYKQRNVICNIDELFEGLKKTLMQSNMNIVTVTKENGVLTAKGEQYNDETITEITVSLSFKAINSDMSNVAMIASYNVMEKKLNTGQIGFVGVSLPVPVPLTGKYAMIGSGHIDDPLWYQGFFDSLDKMLFEEKMAALK